MAAVRRCLLQHRSNEDPNVAKFHRNNASLRQAIKMVIKLLGDIKIFQLRF